MQKIAWIDFETGGLDPKLHDITQAAVIIEVDGKVVEEVSFLAKPSLPSRVSAEALRVTGQTLEEVMAHPLSQRDLYNALTALCEKYVDKFDREDKFIWAGQNPRFDVDFARALWDRAKDKYFGSWFWGTPVDLIELSMLLRMRGLMEPLPNYKLGTIAAHLGVPLDAHKAIEDVRATRACFYKLLDRIPAPATAAAGQ